MKTILLKLKFNHFLIVIISSFIIHKSILLLNYNFYDGKIVGFEIVNHTFHNFKGGNGYEKRALNIIEYYKDNKTIKYTDGDGFTLNFNAINDNVKVIINKNNSNDIRIFSLFHYWINIQEFILLGLVLFIIYGLFYVFFKKTTTKKS